MSTAPQWPEPRPIEEAPTDGSELLLWFPGLLPLPPKPEKRK